MLGASPRDPVVNRCQVCTPGVCTSDRGTHKLPLTQGKAGLISALGSKEGSLSWPKASSGTIFTIVLCRALGSEVWICVCLEAWEPPVASFCDWRNWELVGQAVGSCIFCRVPLTEPLSPQVLSFMQAPSSAGGGVAVADP